MIAACGEGTTTDPPQATTITVSPATVDLRALGATVELSVQVHDQNGQPMTGAAVTWASGAVAVATVDGSGLVTAVANGSATITASAGGASGTAAVTVAQAPDSVAVVPGEANIDARGHTLQLAAEAFDENGHAVAGAEFEWASSDDAVATVDGSGLVTAVANGSATITASAGEASGTAAVTVAAPQVLSVRTVYAIPRNREFVQAYSDSVGAALRHLQGWYRDQMDGLTFELATTVPEVCRLSVDDDFLTVHPGDESARWRAALDAVSECGPPRHNDPSFIWVVYFDVDEPCGRPLTLGRGGGGLAMLGRWDLIGLTDPGFPLPCGRGGQPQGRWVGGLGHELGHAFGLPHPPGCDAGLPTCDYWALMWVGFARWPDTYLRDDEKRVLRASPFFAKH